MIVSYKIYAYNLFLLILYSVAFLFFLSTSAALIFSDVIKVPINSQIKLVCNITGYINPLVKWEKLDLMNYSLPINKNDYIKENKTQGDINEKQNILKLSPITKSDNGTYICKVQSGDKLQNNESIQIFHIFVIEQPNITIDKVNLLDSRTANISWTIHSDGGSSLQGLSLQIRNLTQEGSDFIDINRTIEVNSSSVIINRLIPACEYEFRIRVSNNAGWSEWSSTTTNMTADVPSQVSELHFLNKTNRTIFIGWKNAAYNNGAEITQFELQLKDSNDDIVYNSSKYVNTISKDTTPSRNLMFVFTELKPASNYTARVRACSSIGCGDWSESLFVTTSDGMADPPENVSINCIFDKERLVNQVLISWEHPIDPRGTIVSYNITLEGNANYLDINGLLAIDSFKEKFIVEKNSYNWTLDVKPNTNYTVRICTNNKAGCGDYSNVTSSSMCYSFPTVPPSFPSDMKLSLLNSSDPYCRKLKLSLSRISERNGAIRCYRVIMIRLPEGEMPELLENINVTTYSQVHSNDNHTRESVGAYVAEEIPWYEWKNEVIIGDDVTKICDQRMRRRVKLVNFPKIIEDGVLDASTNYTGFLEVLVVYNETIFQKKSDFFNMVLIGAVKPDANFTSPLNPILLSLNDSATAILFGIICGLTFVLILLFIVICFIRKKANEPGGGDHEEEERLGLTALLRRTVTGYKNGYINSAGAIFLINSNHKWIGQPTPIQNLPSIFVERHANNDFLFQTEFEALPDEINDRTYIDSNLPENIGKNRYPDIKCFDQTRVRLIPIENKPGSDYINANFVEGYKGYKLYICAQGPLDRTVFDFWRMIYEHKVSVIVMLTGIEEHGKIKCAQYWNDSGVKDIDGLYTLTFQSCRKYSDFIIRRFLLEKNQIDNDKKELPRDILQFHFLLWKDFLAPEQPSWLLRFVKRVNEHYCPDKGPLLVHCSAGVGRTGTFIAIDSLLSEVTNGPTINVFECVSQLRYQRNFLVQSLRQYIFVYRALMEFAQFGDTEIEICHLRDHYNNLKEQKFEGNVNGVMAEFDRLSEVIEDKKSCLVGLMDMNMSKNRYDFIIPYDINRVILPPSPLSTTKENSSYINASFVQGYDRSLSFIITQDPLDCTVFEFWRMIMEQNVTTLVMLSELGEGQSKCHCYWPKKNQMYNYIEVIMEKEEHNEHYKTRKFEVSNTKSKDSIKLMQYQFTSWKSGVAPEATLPLLNLIETALSNNNDIGSPIVVHCSGGGDRSSLFVTLASLIQQVRLDERVDIFQTARYTRSQRQCMLQSIAQYDFLYRSLIDLIDCHNLCDNLGDTQL